MDIKTATAKKTVIPSYLSEKYNKSRIQDTVVMKLAVALVLAVALGSTTTAYRKYVKKSKLTSMIG